MMPSLRDLTMLQSLDGLPMRRAWRHTDNPNHRANKQKKRARKAQRKARRVNRG